MFLNRNLAAQVFGAFAVIIASACSGTSADQRPNILLIVADDLGFSDVGAYGSEVATPNLDELAFEGLRFSQFHTIPKCFPSRATILTGLYPEQVGRDKAPYSGFSAGQTIAEAVSRDGYLTFMVGKHHGTDNPLDFGFDHYSGLRDGASNHFNPGIEARRGEPEPARKRSIREAGRWFCFDRNCQRGWSPDEPDYYSTDTYTDWALEYLATTTTVDSPFFLYLSYQAPHDPLHAWPEDIERYRDRYRTGFAQTAGDRFEKQRRLGLIDDSFPRAQPGFRDWDEMTSAERDDAVERMAVYSAMIDRLDYNVGRLLDFLRENGELDNTMIVFTSDNGASAELVFAQDSTEEIGAQHAIGTVGRWASLGNDWANVANTPYRLFKNYSHEGGSAVPLIVSWPAAVTSPGRVVHDNTHAIDLMPSLLAAAGVDYNGSIALPGIDLSPYMHGSAPQERGTPTFTRWSSGRSVRTSDWKLVSWSEGEDNSDWELYDVRIDKTETRDVANEHPDIVQELSAEYDRWLASVTQ